MSLTRRITINFFFAASALLFAACGPTYPKCENNDHCSDKGEYCYSGKCSQCAVSEHCKGAGMECNQGVCERIAGYCDPEVACPGKQKCRDNRCGDECLGDNECSETQFCDSGSCSERPECGANALTPACPEGKECVGGACQIKIVECTAEPVYFDYNRHNVKRSEGEKIESVATCLQGDNVANLVVEGHCDERGTEEYNMALGEKRAAATKKRLVKKGAPEDKISTMSYGKNRPAADGSNESAWKNNRRSEFAPSK